MTHYDDDTLYEFESGECPADLSSEVAAHVSVCGRCEAIVVRCRSLRRAVAGGLPEYSSSFTNQVMARVERARSKNPREWFGGWFVPALQLAGALGLIVFHFASSSTPDLSTILLSGADEDATREDLAPRVSDLGVALGIGPRQTSMSGS